MLVSNNVPFNGNEGIDKDKKKPQEVKNETVIKRDITVNIKEEIKLTGTQTGPIPSIPAFTLFPHLPADPMKVSNALNAIDSLVHENEKGKLAAKFGDFSRAIEGMNNDQLLQVAENLGSLMKDTDGNDDLLGELQKLIFDKMKSAFAPFIQPPQLPIQPQSPDLTQTVENKETENNEVTSADLEWALKIQEKIKSGESVSPEDEARYNDIQIRYSKQK